jgi:hypothetical protein
MVRLEFEDLAMKELQRGLDLDPRIARARYLLGERLVYRSDIDGGIREFQRERAINPNYAMVHCKLGGACGRTGSGPFLFSNGLCGRMLISADHTSCWARLI